MKLARGRGFRAVHVNEINLRSVSDKRIARYAVDNGMILVTNNMTDFTRLYGHRPLHPGLIFLQCNVKRLFTDANQATMLGDVLDDLLENDLVQEVVSVTLSKDGKDLIVRLTRHMLPKS